MRFTYDHSSCIDIHSQFTRAYQNHIKYNLPNTVATCSWFFVLRQLAIEPDRANLVRLILRA